MAGGGADGEGLERAGVAAQAALDVGMVLRRRAERSSPKLHRRLPPCWSAAQYDDKLPEARPRASAPAVSARACGPDTDG